MPITWRSIATPDFESTTQTMQQGMNSLSRGLDKLGGAFYEDPMKKLNEEAKQAEIDKLKSQTKAADAKTKSFELDTKEKEEKLPYVSDLQKAQTNLVKAQTQQALTDADASVLKADISRNKLDKTIEAQTRTEGLEEVKNYLTTYDAIPEGPVERQKLVRDLIKKNKKLGSNDEDAVAGLVGGEFDVRRQLTEDQIENVSKFQESQTGAIQGEVDQLTQQLKLLGAQTGLTPRMLGYEQNPQSIDDVMARYKDSRLDFGYLIRAYTRVNKEVPTGNDLELVLAWAFDNGIWSQGVKESEIIAGIEKFRALRDSKEAQKYRDIYLGIQAYKKSMTDKMGEEVKGLKKRYQGVQVQKYKQQYDGAEVELPEGVVSSESGKKMADDLRATMLSLLPKKPPPVSRKPKGARDMMGDTMSNKNFTEYSFPGDK